jgi:hypothetical protein
MTLNPHPTFPATGHYVLRLHQDALSEAGRLTGRIQHVSSGNFTDFATGEDLLAWLVRHAALLRPSSDEPPRGDA